MSTPESRGGVAAVLWPDPLEISASAHGSQVRLFRRQLSCWLSQDHLDPDMVDDLVLATSEALENCCDHAYADNSAVGTMTLIARTTDEGLVVTVADEGGWRRAGSGPSHRGRGLAMMRELVDEVVLVAGDDGTQLSLIRHVDW